MGCGWGSGSAKRADQRTERDRSAADAIAPPTEMIHITVVLQRSQHAIRARLGEANRRSDIEQTRWLLHAGQRLEHAQRAPERVRSGVVHWS
jgi:hypothetical protein